MGIVFVISVLMMYFLSIYDNRKGGYHHGLEVDSTMFATTKGFAEVALIILGLLAALYGFFW